MSDIMRDIVAIVMAVIGLAMLAVIIKSNNTSSVLNAGFGGLSNLIGTAAKG